MTIASGIQDLRNLVGRIPGDGPVVAARIVEQMRDLERQAAAEALDQFARLCRLGAEAIDLLAQDPARFAPRADQLVSHLNELVQFGDACLEMVAKGGDLGSVIAPSALLLQSDDDDRHFVETVGMFVTHAMGALSDLEEDLLSLEASERPEETIAAIRRIVHTLKAEFAVLNLPSPQALCHQAETTIDICVENGAAFPIDTMLALVDQLKQFVERLAQNVRAAFGDAEPMMRRLRDCAAAARGGTQASNGQSALVLNVEGEFADSLPEFITEARSHLAEAEVALVELARQPDDLENLNLTFRAFHTIKGVAGFLNLTPLVELAHVAETLLDGGRAQRFRFESEDIDLVLAAGDMLQQMIHSLEGQSGPSVGEWQRLMGRLHERANRRSPTVGEAVGATRASGQVAALASAAEVASAETPAQAHPEPEVAPASNAIPPGERPSPARPSDDGGESGPRAAGSETKAARVERTIKVSTTRLDMLVDMVGELVIAQSMVLQDPAIQRLDNQSLARNIGQVGKITRDLQEAAMSLRMVTVKATFQKMARLVRDVAGKSGKKVALTISGEDTELDRNVVEQISDPLVHMIRNAIDHGIEKPTARVEVGKEAEGSLSLRAYHQGGSIVIEIADDGRGIDRQKVLQKAIDKELLAADVNAQALSDAEVFNLIFLPGFSTAEKVTDLSGRGVGMDVVRRNIEALRGKIEIESTLGKGTVFRLRLPLTLAIIDGMIVRVGKQRYVVPTLSIEQSFRPSPDDIHHLVDRGECVRVRGTVLPVYRLKQIFDLREGFDALADGILIVVETDGQRSCLFVDEILGQQQVVIKSLGMSRDRVAGLSGGAIMTDGLVALILDVGTLVESVLSA